MKKFYRFGAVSLLSAILAACAPYHRQVRDGAPNFNVDVSKIPNAVPKVEPACRFGNPPSYNVLGHRYYVMKSSHGYDERGIASWYGTLFHKHRTSCGEPYNMLAMTAASKVLPLPTYAEVTNLQNGKRVIVKVNDRGPFEKNRILDLSWVAAKKLGIIGHGTGYVEVKAIDPRKWNEERQNAIETPIPEHKLPLKHPGSPIIYLQVGAFGNLEKAKEIGRKVATLTHRVVRIQKKAGTSIYRVQIGPISGVSETDSISNKLLQAGYSEPMTVLE